MRLEVVTPRGSVLSVETDEVVAPGIIGEFGILPGHIPFLSGLAAGELRYQQAHGLNHLRIGPGFLEVTHGERIIVLTSEAARVNELEATSP